jgi:hypothetical protein
MEVGRCALSSCPLLVDGTCLEGFPDPVQCPNYLNDLVDDMVAEVETDNAEAGAIDVAEKLSDVEVAPTLERYVGGDEALSASEAGSITASRATSVVLVAGEYESGKTTLVVELFAQFLAGPFAGWSFGGSRTLAAFDKRHRPARLSSGARHATTERTQDDDMRLLHLEFKRGEDRANLLISDVKGEFFDDLTSGGNVAERVPLAARADMCIFVLNGAQLVEPSSRGAAFWRARLTLGALTEPEGLDGGIPVIFVISKCDLLTVEQLDAAVQAAQPLVDFAHERGLTAEMLAVSARPLDTHKMPIGLEKLLAWLTADRQRSSTTAPASEQSTGRYFWRSEGKA